jgi:DNA-binding winged helix-turn-helix (wHTH) protein
LEAQANGRLRFAEYELDPPWGRLLRDGHPVKIQPQPLRVLAILARQAGQIVSQEWTS